MVLWVVAACPVPGGFPPPVNVVNRAYQMYRLRMPIWSFYDKTYIVIPTCTSNISRPSAPRAPAIAVDLRIEEQVWVGPELPGSCCQTYVTGSKGIFHCTVGKMCNECVG